MTHKLTEARILSLVEKETYFVHGTLTLCVLDLKNGAQIVGQSNVIDPANYREAVGREIARENALDRIWELEGYALKTRGPYDS